MPDTSDMPDTPDAADTTPPDPDAALTASVVLENQRLAAFQRRIGAAALLTLQLRTAEMLGFPTISCGYRACRRARRCLWVRQTTPPMPVCLDRLLDEERPGYDEFLDYVVELYALTRGRCWTPHLFLLLQQSPDYMHAAVEIIRHALPPGDRGRDSLEQALRDIWPVRRQRPHQAHQARTPGRGAGAGAPPCPPPSR